MYLNSIRSRLALSFAGIALVAALALGAVLLTILRDYYSNQELNYLHVNAQSVSTVIGAMMSAHATHDEAQSQVESLAFLTLTRIRVYGLNGQVLYDSGSPQNLKVKLGVVKQTLIQSNDALPKDKVFISVGGAPNGDFPFPETVTRPVPEGLTSKNIFVYQSNQAGDSAYGFALRLPGEAVPVTTRSKLQVTEIMQNPKTNDKLGSIQLSEGPAYGSAILASVARGWVFSSAIAVLLAALIGWYISRRISAPVLALSDVTVRMAQGDLSSRADVKSRDEFGQLASSFNSMAVQIEQTISTLREFVADAAHELHTPLTALQANLELARDETLAPGAHLSWRTVPGSAGENASARTRYLMRAQEQSRRLEALVQSLLDLSRIEAAQARPNFATVDLIQLVQEVGEQFASRAEQADRSFTMNIPEEMISVQGNETQLRQVMINLLENALKFTPASGWISLNLEITMESASLLANLREQAPTLQNRSVTTLTVSDSGIGIPPEDLPHLFERFHRGRNAAEYPGNGLGLAIVKAIVNAHQGNVSVQSEPGHGTSISVSLPIE